MSYKKALLASISIMAILSSAVLGESHPEELEADVVVYGATPGGISARAVQKTSAHKSFYNIDLRLLWMKVIACLRRIS